MSNRVFKLIAFAVLIGAPIVVQVLSSTIPAVQHDVEAAETARPVPLAATQAPPPPPSTGAQPEQADPSSDALIESAPTLDTQGIAPTAVGGQEYAAAPAASSPPQRAPVDAYDEKIGPPPPQRPASMDR